MRVLLGVIALVIGVAAANAADDAPPPPIRQFDIPTIERLGREMYEQDQLAWKATDIVFAKHKKEELVAQKQHGWIVDTFPDHAVVRFIRETDSAPVAAYDVTFTSGMASGYAEPQNAPLSDEELAQYDARTIALKNIDRMCAENLNTVVLKDPEGDGWLVWVMAATTKPDVMIVGGHYRFMISKDGKTVLREDKLSRGCLNIPKPHPTEDQKTLGAFIGHLVSLTPIETYVFDSISYHETFNISTLDGRAWKIVEGHVEEVSMDMPGDDGVIARVLAGVDENCLMMVTDADHPSNKPDTFATDSVITATEKKGAFVPKIAAGKSANAIFCARSHLFLAPNDYKVLQAGVVLYVGDRGKENARKMGALELVGGRVQFRQIEGAPLTSEEQALMNTRLNAFQDNFYTKK